METSHSLLEHVRAHADPDSWQRLVALYTPLLQTWMRRYDVLAAADVDDLTQEVLLAVARDLPTFDHRSEPGAFRRWLRVILIHRLRNFWRARQHRPMAVGGSDFLKQLEQLEDAGSVLSQLWDHEHDRHVLNRLLDEIEPRFAPLTWQAFRRQVLDGASAETVAHELNMPLPSVYAAKSRIVKALRQLAAGLVP
jgi:RNA polymerase sigma-70 factor (ECF subfamily)